MNGKSKSLLALTAAAALLLSVVTGCGNGGGETTRSQGGESQGGDEEQRVTIRYLGDTGQGTFPEGQDENDNDIVRFLEEQTGFDLEFKYVATPEERNAILASGEVYDIVRLRSTGEIGQFYEQDLLAPLDDYLADAGNILRETPESTWGAGTIDGRRYAITVPYASPYWGLGVRRDWMENLGLDEPRTIDDLYELLRAFTQDDPDGNGQNDTVGLSMYGNSVGWVTSYGVGGFGSNFFWSLFDLPNEYILKDGVPVYAPVTDNAREMLLFLNRLWSDGLLDQEFAINDPAKLSEKIVGGKAGVVDITYWHYQAWSQQLAEQMGEDVFVTIPPPKTYEGNDLKYREVGPADSYRVVLKQSAHPAEAVRFLDRLLDPAITAVTTFGWEGVHWNRNGDEIELTDAYEDISYIWYYRDGLYFSRDMMDKVEDVEYGSYRSRNYAWTGGEETWSLLSIVPPMTEHQDALNKIRELTQTRLLQFIVGEKDVETEFDAFVDEWRAAGGEDILAAIKDSL